MRAGSLMTTWPVAVTPQATIADALDLVRTMEIRHLPVVDRGTLVGMVSDRDLTRVDPSALLTHDGADALRRELATPVMHSDVICVEPETDVSHVIELLLEHKLGALPVVHPKTHAIVGILSYIDVLRGVQEELEDEQEN
jgi:acetoin utilization protein AcuB